MREKKYILKLTTLCLCTAMLLTNTLQSSASSTILGTDDRIVVSDAQADPYRAICRLVIHWPDGSVRYGTGFAYGERLIATAAHGLYHPDKGGAAQKIEIYFGASEQAAPFAQRTVSTQNSHFHIPEGWIQTQNWKYDYGAIELTDPINTKITPLKLVKHPANKLHGMDARLLGYDYLSKNLYQSEGQIAQVRQYDLLYQMDTLYGESGGPILDPDGNVIGIANYGAEKGGLPYNSAARMSGDAYQFLQQVWENSLSS